MRRGAGRKAELCVTYTPHRERTPRPRRCAVRSVWSVRKGQRWDPDEMNSPKNEELFMRPLFWSLRRPYLAIHSQRKQFSWLPKTDLRGEPRALAGLAPGDPRQRPELWAALVPRHRVRAASCLPVATLTSPHPLPSPSVPETQKGGEASTPWDGRAPLPAPGAPRAAFTRPLRSAQRVWQSNSPTLVLQLLQGNSILRIVFCRFSNIFG